MEQRYVPRFADHLLDELMSGLPALFITGPRATGKTTTAARHAASVVRLDRETEAEVFRADPDVALQRLPEPILLDEWQAVPGVLGAVKRAVDTDSRPGRFLVAGGVRADMAGSTWPGTGRLVRVPMWGLAVREMRGDPGAEGLLHKIAKDGVETLPWPADPPDLRGYIEMALLGGFPEPALHLPPARRMGWYDSYLHQVTTRDTDLIDTSRDPVRLKRYLEALAACTASVVGDKTLYEAARINSKTAAAYDRLLSNLLLHEAVPAWHSSRLKRLTRQSKRYIVDPSLVGASLGLETEGVLRSGIHIGLLIETFVAAQIRAELPLWPRSPRLYHLRDRDGRREIDLIVELSIDRIIAIEVKAKAGPSRAAAKHLEWLRDQIGEQFVAGVVLHTGPYVYRLADRIVAAPIASLWS